MNKRAMANPDPLSQAYWISQLNSINPTVFADTQTKAKQGRGYFERYKGRKLKEVPAASKPVNTIDAQISQLPATGTQICVYRCMGVSEAKNIGIEYTAKLASVLSKDYLSGHLGQRDYSTRMCNERQTSAASEPNVLAEFLPRPNAHDLLFSPNVAAIGTKSSSTAVIAETTLQRGETTKYVVTQNSEGYVNGFIGIKSEKDYFSLAMQDKKPKDLNGDPIPVKTDSKTLMWRLIESARAIPPGQQATCTPPPRPVIPSLRVF